jgi:signal transduction histidine kinase
LRRLSKTLINEHIDQSDIIDLIKEECEKVNALNVYSIVFRTNIPEISTPYNIRDTIIKIIQEFFQNSLKHAKCTTMEVIVESNTNGIKIIASDNGIGFNLQQQTEIGVGLSNMRKRANDIGACLEIRSEVGKGTHIDIFIPINKMIL